MSAPGYANISLPRVDVVTPPAIEISVVIVAWNVASHVMQCLDALADAITPTHTWEAIVVDNASSDDTIAQIQRWHADVKVIANPSNRLYTAAANQGLAAARGRYLLLLNPDTLPRPGSIDALLRYAAAHADVGLVGPRILDANGRVDLRTARHYPSPCSEFLDWLGLSRRFPRSRWWAANLRPWDDRSTSGPVPLLSGACMLLTPTLPPDLRRFDDGYMMYGEDVDLCRRVQAAGYQTALAAEAVIIHHGGESSRQAAAQTAVWAADGVNRYFRRWRGESVALRHRAGMAVVGLTKWLWFSALGLCGQTQRGSYQRQLHAGLLRWALSGRVKMP